MTTERVKHLITACHLAAASKLLLPLADAGSPQAQLEMLDIYLKRQMPRAAAQYARTILHKDNTHFAAQLRLCEALVMLNQGELALETIPSHAGVGEEIRLASVHSRALLASLRQKGERLWSVGDFEKGRDTYRQLHAEEKRIQSQFRAILNADPSNMFAWNALVDAVGNYHLSSVLTKAMPKASSLQSAFLEAITGNPEHPVQKYLNISAATFRSLSDWPHKNEVVASLSSNPRKYLPSVYGAEVPQIIPARVAPRNMVKLNEAVAFDAGMSLWIRSAKGDVPWLHEGMWREYVGPYMPTTLPSPYIFLEANGGSLSVLPQPSCRIEQPVVVLGYWNNYGHVLHDIIPQLEDAEAVLGKDFYILAVDSLLPSIRDIFSRAGYGADKIITIGEGCTATIHEAYCIAPRTQFQNLRYFKSHLSPEFRHYDMSLDDLGIEFARQRLMNEIHSKSTQASRKIYASRRRTARRPDNEQEIESMLAARGFEIMVPEELSLQEQIEIFADTKILVALEGAALANAMFMPAEGIVLSLRSMAWGWSVNCFDELSRIRGFRFEVFDFEGRSVPLDALNDWLSLRQS
ncbi:MAG: glycosyltransferase family 61 protein [Alphaproteobacteria bacterium]